MGGNGEACAECIRLLQLVNDAMSRCKHAFLNSAADDPVWYLETAKLTYYAYERHVERHISDKAA